MEPKRNKTVRTMDLADQLCVQKDRVRVKRKTLEAVLQQCQFALEQLASGCDDENDNSDGSDPEVPQVSGSDASAPDGSDNDTNEFYNLLKSRVECVDFIKKLEDAQACLPGNITEEGSSWDMVNENDLWEGGNDDVDPEEYVLVGQDDIMDGIASFMAAYLLSLKQTKDLTPDQLQTALSKTFSATKNKGRLRKLWDGSKVVYNVASWGATAIGIYQNPALLRAASTVFWTSCHVISKFF